MCGCSGVRARTMRRPFDLIAFDGDDTLWHNERSFRHGRDRFRAILADAGFALPEDTIESVVNEIEVQNLPFFGYGVSSFTLSLIEAAVGLTNGQIAARHIDAIVAVAKTMITSEVELFPAVKPALASLSRRYPLVLITKGDLLHQRSKLTRSGLERYFRYVEVVSDKTPEVYAAILERLGIRAGRFLMVGNSLKSDILPVLALGGRGAHIPYHLTWAAEHVDEVPDAPGRFFTLQSVRALPALVEAWGL